MHRVAFTIGHGTRSTEEIAGMLHDAGVTRLVDIRRFPASRRSPHLSRADLAVSLPALGIEYRFEGDTLGGRRRSPKNRTTRHPAWRHAAFSAYADHMDTAEFRDALLRLERLASEQPTTVLCAETLWWRCHRRLVADALSARGWKVIHLVSPTSQSEHPPNESMRLDTDGWPVFDVGLAT